MRLSCRYNNILNNRGDPTGLHLSGLHLSLFFPFRVAHPPLFVPWSDISVAGRWDILFIGHVKLLLGREEQIPFVISDLLADRIQSAGGASWPIEQIS